MGAVTDVSSWRAGRSAEQRLLERKGRQHLRAGRGHQDLLLELDPLGATLRADIALDADRHVLLKDPIIARTRQILDMGDLRSFVAHAAAVGDAGIAGAGEGAAAAPSLLPSPTNPHPCLLAPALLLLLFNHP